MKRESVETARLLSSLALAGDSKRECLEECTARGLRESRERGHSEMPTTVSGPGQRLGAAERLAAKQLEACPLQQRIC